MPSEGRSEDCYYATLMTLNLAIMFLDLAVVSGAIEDHSGGRIFRSQVERRSRRDVNSTAGGLEDMVHFISCFSMCALGMDLGHGKRETAERLEERGKYLLLRQ